MKLDRKHRLAAAVLVIASSAACGKSDTVATTQLYTLTVVAPAHGAIAGATTGSYASGTTLTLSASAPDATYGLRSWTVQGAPCGRSTTCQITVDGDKTVGADIGKLPEGFAADVNGGAGGEVVTVTTGPELEAALCDSVVSGRCADSTPRVVQVASVIDFRNTEGTATRTGCTYSDHGCTRNGRTEQILDRESFCDGKTRYAITYDAAGANPLLVGSNKTVIGIGANAGWMGKGLSLEGGVSNVVVRNLSITDINEGIIWAGDGIGLDGASRVWIDHNYLARIGRMMIAAGWGAAAGVTISNNVFDGTTACGHYCDGRHYWNVLLAGEGQTVTLVGNEFRNTSGDAPQLQTRTSATDGGAVHVVNNLWDGSANLGLLATSDVLTLLEGNYFSDASSFTPLLVTTASRAFAPLDAGIVSASAQCQVALGRGCSGNRATGTTSSFGTNASVMPALQARPAWLATFTATVPYPSADVPARVGATAGPKADPDG